MKKERLKKVIGSPKELKFNKVSTEDYSTLIKESGIYELEDNLPILYVELGAVNKELIKAFQNISYYRTIRTGGLKSHSALLGFKPRNATKDNFCSIAGTSYNHPLEHDLFLETSITLAKVYKKYLPAVYNIHMEKLQEKNDDDKKLLDDYILKNTPFTSGILNKNNVLKYHYDTGNIEGVCSAMIVLKQDVVGGYLSLPEYGVAFEMANNTALFFNGQNIIHGVTPIYKTTEEAYRYSAVYYTLKEMWNCLPVDKELSESRKNYEKQDAV